MQRVRKIALGLVIAGAAVGGTAVAASAQTQVSWTQRTCAAELAYAGHPSTARLDALVVDSFRVAPKYLGADVGQLYADVEGGGTKYVAKDESYIRDDCAS
jgi:hypothetical protein